MTNKERLANAHPNCLSPLMNIVGKSQLLILLVFIDLRGGMIMLYFVLFQEREAVWVSLRLTVLFFSSIIKPVITPILDLLFVEKSNTSIRINISLNYYSIIDRVFDLFFLENSDISIRIGFCQKKITL